MTNTYSLVGLTVAINVHRRLVEDFPSTPYIIWCRHIHKAAYAYEEKLDLLLTWVFDPREYTDPLLFQYDYYAYNLLRKYLPDGELSPSMEQAAMATFMHAEETCARVNRDFFRCGELPADYPTLDRARKIIERILGPIADLFTYIDARLSGNTSHEATLPKVWSQILENQEEWLEVWQSSVCAPQVPRFGPGASVNVTGESGTRSSREKVLFPTYTKNLERYVPYLLERLNLGEATVVKGSVACVVAKNRNTGRTICYEPSLNMLIQLMVGSYLKLQLRMLVGIDLRDQTRNQTMARVGSRFNGDATLDLTSASDLNAYVLVYRLFPSDWFEFLDQIRSQRCFVDGEWIEFQKFSTMGNGFTFELETIIFYALTKASCETVMPSIGRDRISAYGDDLIFPRECYEAVVSTLAHVGHSPNIRKSYSSGPFRESCGGDFFNGHFCTPYYLKELANERDAINLYNGLYRLSRQVYPGGRLCPRFVRALTYLQNRILESVPGISFGPVETQYLNDVLGWRMESSGRYLWTDDVVGEPSCQYNRALQVFMPRTLVEETETILCDYDVSPNVSGYVCSTGAARPQLAEKAFCVVPNPALKKARKKSFKRVNSGHLEIIEDKLNPGYVSLRIVLPPTPAVMRRVA